MSEEIKQAGYHPADTNGDGKVTKKEQDMYLEFKRKELEDADAMRDAQRQMAWYSLYGMLLYPVLVIGSNVVGYEKAADILGGIFNDKTAKAIIPEHEKIRIHFRRRSSSIVWCTRTICGYHGRTQGTKRQPC